MLDIRTEVVYQAFGLNIVSDIKFPELIEGNKVFDSIDVKIQIKDLTKEWKELVSENETYKVQENIVIFKIHNTAIFYIENGNKIFVSPNRDADEDKIRLFLLGTCMGVLLLQRKIIPFHGSAIEIDGKAYAIIGDSGAGKSTLASAFIKQGYKLLSDDVIAVTFSENHIPIVIPSYPQQKLWKESLNEFGMDSKKYRPIIQREAKFAIPVTESFISEAVPLRGIFELVKSEDDNINFRRISGMERLQLLFSHTYRNFLIELLDLLEWHFTCSTEIIKQTEIFEIRRPTTKFTTKELVSLILDSIYKENVKC
jgi:hypothetical protein